jgi:hypothetical protein
MARTDDRSGIAVRGAGQATTRDLSWLDASSIADLTPDGRQVLFTEFGVGGGAQASTYLRGTDGSMAVRLGDGAALSISPDGRWALVQNPNDGTYLSILPTAAGAVRRLARPGFRMLGGRWLGSAREVVAWAREGEDVARLFLLDVEGTATRPLTPEGRAVGRRGWAVSPDGAGVALSGSGGIELFPVAGGAPRLVPGDTTSLQVIGWIQDGLLVSESPAESGVISLLDPATGMRRPWNTIEPQDPTGIMNHDLATLVVTRMAGAMGTPGTGP